MIKTIDELRECLAEIVDELGDKKYIVDEEIKDLSRVIDELEAARECIAVMKEITDDRMTDIRVSLITKYFNTLKLYEKVKGKTL